jgi:hypothetical protein
MTTPTPHNAQIALNVSFSVVQSPADPTIHMVQLVLAMPALNVGALFDAHNLRDNLENLFSGASQMCDQAIAHNTASGIVVASADALHRLTPKGHPHG